MQTVNWTVNLLILESGATVTILLYFAFLYKEAMRTLLKQLTLPAVLSCIMGTLCPVASADSTSDLVLNLQCRGDYNVQIWQDRSSNTLLYRSTSPYGDLSLQGGTKQATEGVQVYKFQNGKYGYWVWDGTLDSQQAGTLEVYGDNRLLMRQDCRKV
jgi:hypothetical protein